MRQVDETFMALTDLGRLLQAEGLTWGSSGNLSMRLEALGSRMAITASGSRLGSLTRDDLVVMDIDQASVENGTRRRPSKEHGMHAAVYRVRPDVGCVVHVSPPHATFLACTEMVLPTNAFPEGMMQLASVGRIGYRHAGSHDLAVAVGHAVSQDAVLLLENHGVLVAAATWDDALLKVQTLEFAARLAFMARATGVPIRELDAGTVAEFRASGYRR